MNEIGEKLVFVRTITPELIDIFSAFSGDFNPMHTGADFTGRAEVEKKLGINSGDRIAHGLLYASLISAPLWRLGGDGAIFGELKGLRFMSPVQLGDTISVELEVAAKEGRKLILNVRYRNQEDKDVIKPTQAILFVRQP